MSQPQRIAVTLPAPSGVAATLELARWAEREGFDDVWFSDSGGIDALSLAAAVGVETRRVRIGTAVVPVYPIPRRCSRRPSTPFTTPAAGGSSSGSDRRARP